MLKDVPPKHTEDGSINLAYFQVKIENLNALNEWHLLHHHEPLKGYNGHLSGLKQEAKLAGVDERAAFGESVEDKTEIALRSILDDRKIDALFEVEDAVLDKIEQSMDQAIFKSKMILEQRLNDAETEAAQWRARQAPKWVSRLKRIRRLREMARHPIPKWMRARDKVERAAWEASHIARWMVYIFRSDIGESRLDRIMSFPDHMAKCCVDYWEARHQVAYRAIAISDRELEAAPHLVSYDGGFEKGVTGCTGLILVMPPGHLKSTIGYAIASWELCVKTSTQGMIVHAKDEEATRVFRYLRDAFKPEDSKGRRLRALMPNAQVEKANNDELWLHNEEPTTNPQMRPVGVGSAVSGANNTFQWWDDIVDPKTINEADVRQTLRDRVSQVFLPRLRTGKTFHLVTATIWHTEDPVNMLIKMAQRGELRYRVSIQRCGGPKTFPAFKPLWDKYPASALKVKYRQIGHHGYACQYEVNPMSDESRIIRKVQLYLSNIDQCPKPTDCKDWQEEGRGCGKCHMCLIKQHREFLHAAQYHLSLDPSATSEETKKNYTDKSGLIWAAFGEVVQKTKTADMIVSERATRLRVLEAQSFYASSTEAVSRLYQFASMNKVDYVHVETVGFSVAIVETIRNQTGLSSSNIIGHKVNAKSKRQRLMDVAPLIEASGFEAAGLNPPVVEFPGVLDENGNLIPKPELSWLYDQIVNFGQTGEDHCVDALSQLCKHISPMSESGSGAFTSAVQDMNAEKSLHEQRKERMSEMYAHFRRRKQPDPIREEISFITGVEPWNP